MRKQTTLPPRQFGRLFTAPNRGTLDLFVKQCLRNSFLSVSRFSMIFSTTNLKQMVGCHTKSCVTPKINTLVLKSLCNKILSIFAYQRVSGKLRPQTLKIQTLKTQTLWVSRKLRPCGCLKNSDPNKTQ